jgi:ABC-2 type transport system permease protein
VRMALNAEWTKLRTVAGNGWLVVGTVGLTVALSALAAATEHYPSVGAPLDTTKLSLTGIYLGQAVVAILAVQVVGSEYASGTIRMTFVALPRRAAVLAAKATVLAGVVLVAGIFAVGGCLLAGRLILRAHGFTAAHGYPLLSLANGPTLRAAAGSVLYLALIGLLGLGVATAVRSSAAAIGVVLGLLYLFPIIAALVTDPRWQRFLQRIGPMTAGLSIQATTNLRSLPTGPWAGLAVLGAWAVGALLLGELLLLLRDA